MRNYFIQISDEFFLIRLYTSVHNNCSIILFMNILVWFAWMDGPKWWSQGWTDVSESWIRLVANSIGIVFGKKTDHTALPSLRWWDVTTMSLLLPLTRLQYPNDLPLEFVRIFKNSPLCFSLWIGVGSTHLIPCSGSRKEKHRHYHYWPKKRKSE